MLIEIRAVKSYGGCFWIYHCVISSASRGRAILDMSELWKGWGEGARLYLRSATGYKYPLSHTWRSVSSRDCLIRTFSTCRKKEDIWACPQCLNLHDCINFCLRTIPSNFQPPCVWETSSHTPVAPQAMYMCMYLTHFQYTNTHGERGLERLSCAVTSADVSRDYFWPF